MSWALLGDGSFSLGQPQAPQGQEPRPAATQPLALCCSNNPQDQLFPTVDVKPSGMCPSPGGVTHLPACPDPRCPAQHPPRSPPALPCPAQATDENKERGWRLSGCPAPHREALLAHTSCSWAPGGLERHPIPQDPSLQVGHCDLNPKQLLSPSAVSLCHGRGHLPCLKSLYQALQGTFTPLTSPWARSGGGGHQTITRVLSLGFQTLPRALRAYSQACSLSLWLQSCRGWHQVPVPSAPPVL